MTSYIIIDTELCFECGVKAQEFHHVIPKVRGGTKTIPLCSECHCKVHELKNRPNHSQLTKEGLIKAKNNGVVLGSPKNLTPDAIKKGTQAIINNAKKNINNMQALQIIIALKKEGRTLEQIASYLNKIQYRTRYGKEFYPITVSRLYKRYSIQKLDIEKGVIP